MNMYERIDPTRLDREADAFTDPVAIATHDYINKMTQLTTDDFEKLEEFINGRADKAKSIKSQVEEKFPECLEDLDKLQSWHAFLGSGIKLDKINVDVDTELKSFVDGEIKRYIEAD